MFTEAVEPLTAHLVGHARSVLKCEGLARDAVQDTLLRLWQFVVETGGLPESLAPWLCRAVIRRSLQNARASNRRSRREECVGRSRADASLFDDPAETLQSREAGQTLDGLLNQLAPEYREVLLLREYQGIDYAAVAQQLGLPIGTVRSRLSRARTALRDALAAGVCSEDLAVAHRSAASGAETRQFGVVGNKRGEPKRQMLVFPEAGRAPIDLNRPPEKPASGETTAAGI